MNIEHLKSMLFQKNKKGKYRDINIRPKVKKFDYKSGGQRSTYDTVISRCSHCSDVVAITRRISVVSATCQKCLTRDRLARLQVR